LIRWNYYYYLYLLSHLGLGWSLLPIVINYSLNTRTFRYLSMLCISTHWFFSVNLLWKSSGCVWLACDFGKAIIMGKLLALLYLNENCKCYGKQIYIFHISFRNFTHLVSYLVYLWSFEEIGNYYYYCYFITIRYFR